MPLDLKQQRTLSAKIGSSLYQYVVRTPTREEWLKYFDSVIVEEQAVERTVVRNTEYTAARVELLGKVLLNVVGYSTENDQPITEIANWRDLLPVSHRSAFADLLFECGLDTESTAPAMLGAELVTLRARWTESPDGKGMLEYAGLKHIFRVPSVEQQRRYSRDQSRSEITGGRRGKTRYLGAQRTLVALYDELIVRVEGYTSDGEPLNNRTDLIVATMDTFHKAQAMGAVFAPIDVDSSEDEAA